MKISITQTSNTLPANNYDTNDYVHNLFDSVNAVELAWQASKATESKKEQKIVGQYLPKDIFKPFLNQILPKLNEDDARGILQAVFNELSKDDSNIKLGSSIETSIITFMVEKAS